MAARYRLICDCGMVTTLPWSENAAWAFVRRHRESCDGHPAVHEA